MWTSQNVDRIDHVVFLYRTEAGLAAARDEFSRVLNIEDWEKWETNAITGYAHAYISFAAGIELIAPNLELGTDHPFMRHLAEKGEGFYGLVYGVKDLDAARKRVENEGLNVLWEFSGDHSRSVSRLRELQLEQQVGGVVIALGEILPAD